MAEIGDVIQARHEFTVQGVQGMNVFYFQIGAGSTGPLTLASFIDDYADRFLPFWQGWNPTSNTFDRVVMDNLTDGLEFAEASIGAGGGQTGDPLPAVWALNVTLPRTSKITRNGSKRISGFIESEITNGVWTLSGGVVTAVTNWCTGTFILEDYDGAGSNVNILGRIVGRTKNPEGVYELDLSKLNSYGAPILNTVATTQRTRKA